jgi:hypothetical protein
MYIRKIGVDGTITIVVNGSEPRFSGDGGRSAEAQLDLDLAHLAIAVDAEERLLFVDSGNYVIRRVDSNVWI